MPKGFRKHRFSDSAWEYENITAEKRNICIEMNVIKVLLILSFLLTVAVTSFELKSGRSRDDGYDILGQNENGNSGSAVVSKLTRSILHRHPRQAKEDICFSNITVTSHGGAVTSPDFPNLYPSDQDCKWLLTVPDDNRIVLKIETLHLELTDDCDLDYLKIYFGPLETDPSIGPFCGTIKDRVIYSNSTTVSIAFHSDSSYEEEGFSIEYYIESVEACEANLTASSGIITSPQFPKNYPSNSDCWTLISVTENNTIFMQFDLLEVEFNENCTYDYVEVFDGFTKDSPSLGRFCSNTYKPAIQSTTNVLLLHFKSDPLINGKGFQAQYSSIPWILHKFGKSGDCLWERNLINGTITSPSFPEKYPNSSYCKILLTAPPDHVITVFFERLQLEVNCSCDYVEVKDGFLENSILLGKYCGEFNKTKEITSSQERLQITFNSNECAQFPGFIARYYFHNMVPAVTTSNESEDEDIFIEAPQNSTLPAGGSYYLPCVSKITSANISWLKDDEFLQEKTPFLGLKMMANNTLWIKSMNRHLIGVYTCIAVIAEKTFYAKAWVNMEIDSTIDTVCNIVLQKIPKDTSFTEGKFSYLECLARGRQIEYSWEKNGAPLETKQRITMLQNGFLLFDKTTVEDSGIYTCIISDLILGCQKRVDAVLTIRRKHNVNEICGHPKLKKPTEEEIRSSHSKIVGGHDSEKGAHPWQVMLWDPKLKSFCGGSLLNEFWIVTAAHCFKTKDIKWNQIVIKLGKHNREDDDAEEIETNIEDPSSIIYHPGFDQATFDNDIALVRLNDYINFTNYVLPICLVEQDVTENLFQDLQPKMGTVTGWGQLKHNIDRSIIRQWEKEKYKMAQPQNDLPKVLQEIRLPIVNQSICVSSTHYAVTRNMFCAGYAQEVIGDSCQGDSGGPFAMESEGKWYLIGVVSWGEECGKPGKYGFYTKIRNYLPWIKAITNS